MVFVLWRNEFVCLLKFGVKMTKIIELEIPEEILLAAQMDTERMGDEMRKLAAFELFAQHRLSGGKAAQLARMSRIAFLLAAGQRGIEWLPYDAEELSRELQ